MSSRLYRRSLAGLLAASVALGAGMASAAPLPVVNRAVVSESPVVQVGHRHWHHGYHGYHHGYRGYHHGYRGYYGHRRGSGAGAAVALGALGVIGGIAAAQAAQNYPYYGAPRLCRAVDAYTGAPVWVQC